jgi:hypothetical protein
MLMKYSIVQNKIIRSNPVVNLQSVFVLIILIFGFSCMEKASRGKNPKQTILDEDEKKRILQLYSAHGDSLKKKAAAFLMKHISAHYSSESSVLKRLEEKYAKEKRGREYVDSYRTFFSALKVVSEYEAIAEFEKIEDERIVSGDYIIDNIEQAFKAWKNNDRTKDVDFETFCEYILPYRVMDEPLDYDRKFFRKEYTSVIQNVKTMNGAFDTIAKTVPVRYHKAMDDEFPYLMGIGMSYKVSVGNCIQQAVSEAMILRSVGIPATVDYVPQWGNYSGRHYMVKLIDGTKKNTFDLSLSDFKFVISKDSLPKGITDIQYRKTIPKVYRMTWSVQSDRLLLNSNGRPEKTGLFRNLYEKDVTDEYTECSTFSLHVKDTIDVAYLCVFGRKGWLPVCVAPVREDSVVFEKVGRNIVYLPAVYKKDNDGVGYMQPIDDPFYFTGEGSCIRLTGKDRKRHRVKLYSKYPVCSYTAAHAYRMKGGRFQGANISDFSDAKDLFTIDYYPFYKQEVKIENDEKFRYFRYLPPRDAVYSFSELQFYTRDKDGGMKQIHGTYFEKYKTDADFISLSDNDLDTYVRGTPVKDSWVGYDTDNKNGSCLAGIVFAPQNDGNCIIPGYTYELFLWQKGKWMTLGQREAKQNHLKYKNIPENALLWLRCRTKGREERIFTYKNDKQIWW